MSQEISMDNDKIGALNLRLIEDYLEIFSGSCHPTLFPFVYS